ncbi:hypothetical protein HYY69_06565 [Candidatus Woesearchaeota archaeon]|nr:hypothetical protein [Candidatus Woesearchaeota archaeon]
MAFAKKILMLLFILMLLMTFGCKKDQQPSSEPEINQQQEVQPSSISEPSVEQQENETVSSEAQQPDPLPQEPDKPDVLVKNVPAESTKLAVYVHDQSARAVPGAKVSIAKGISYSSTAKSFASATTDTTGNALVEIPADIFGDQSSLYFVVKAEESKHIPMYADNYAVSREKPSKLDLVLYTAPSPETEFELKSREKIILLTKEAITTKVAEEQFTFVYALDIDPDVEKNLDSIDAHFVVTTSDKKPSTDKILTLDDKDIELHKPNGFTLSLPVGDDNGNYGYYLYFDLHYEDGTTEQYPESEKDILYYMNEKMGYVFKIVPASDYAECQPLFDSQNSKMKNKVNLLFINIGEDEEFFKQLAKELVTGKYSFMKQEPFASNKDIFQFWYADKGFEDLNQLVAGETVAYELLQGSMKPDTMPIPNKIKTSCSLANRQIVYIMSSEQPWGVKSVDGFTRIETGRDIYDACVAEKSQQECFDFIRYDAIFAHEFGHQFAALVEQYTSGKLLDVKEYSKKYDRDYNRDPFVNYGSYYSFETRPRDDCIFSNVGSQFYCTSNQQIQKDCSKWTTWKSLIGDGCGTDGVIDCEGKPEGDLEVNCNNMGGGLPPYGDVVVPTKKSLMGDLTNYPGISLFDIQCDVAGKKRYCDTLLPEKNRLYGAVHEQQICRFIELYSGYGKGVCT